MPDLASVVAADPYKQADAAKSSGMALCSFNTTAATVSSFDATKFDFMGLPPELRLHVYNNVQHILRIQLPIRKVKIFTLDLDLTLSKISRQIKPSRLIQAIIDGAFMSKSDPSDGSKRMAFLCESQLQTFALYISRHVRVSRDMGEADSEAVVMEADFMRSYFNHAISQLRVHKILAIHILVDMGSAAGFENPIEFASYFWATMSDVNQPSLDTCHDLRIQVTIVVQLGKAEKTRTAMEDATIRSRFDTSHIEYTVEEVAGELNILTS
ncbi:hypothetical protein HBH56_063830 [Parastagonospora nodorum]|uniref:Uncharacterized protein n=1 Tax=Phaeosphaeria nodorum (strain SN15 / ATCC MYA-4574 / FGSC 10173) TaxID=321614 RepID=Q0V0Y3_PHANO|nr:hypothetical protein SNOG_02331 [Parastagonospora nodorum SN15]KAH3916848.1 hypothetical protein HBH56_063830 [Parastagonospora nodorum]EAT90543.1 hypothetical protein SNOG_02331 [Parastagonospora nodorum SN15]KAH3930662.1 hypothetical protein HBH54_107770 [Parastagonospora nodorum]KAH3954239.1 hypothetical protein HBH53_022860 [Parastagonospora nodorum]KAH3999871.1 hypothetical protein HBI10_104890 [Parastagonospora nodorum]